MNPFLYPKSKHRRTQEPQSFSRYPTYKPFLRSEFRRQCVYCRLPDGIKGQDAFGVDHYRPKSLFPELETVYSNLFYACNCCNRRKGRFWPSSDQMRAGEFIPNPCDHVMFDHLRYQFVRILTHSRAGERAEKVLMFNDAEAVQHREFILGTIELYEKAKKKLQETITKIVQRSQANPQLAGALGAEQHIVEGELSVIDERLGQLGAL